MALVGKETKRPLILCVLTRPCYKYVLRMAAFLSVMIKDAKVWFCTSRGKSGPPEIMDKWLDIRERNLSRFQTTDQKKIQLLNTKAYLQPCTLSDRVTRLCQILLTGN